MECLRVAKLIDRHGELFINRVYTNAEIRYCQSRRHATRQFAAHLAAKEAVLRVVGIRWGKSIRWRDVEIRRDKTGRWIARFRGGVRDAVVERGVSEIQLSLAHCRMHAVAYAVGLGDGG